MRIAIGGDFVPMADVAGACAAGDVDGVFGPQLQSVLKACDIGIINLECPLVDVASPIDKSGPVLGASRSCVKIFRPAGFSVINLANNHAMDHGSAGLRETVNACSNAGLTVVGAGENLAEAARAAIVNVDGMRIAFMGMAEREFGIASADSPGTNPVDPIDFVRYTEQNKASWDVLVVLLHGGNEFFPFPRPSLRKTCHFLIEQGANVVVCQHSHIAGCHEEYRGGHIVYGQGNLSFPSDAADSSWHEGLLIVLDLQPARAIEMNLLPIGHSAGSGVSELMPERPARAFLDKVESRSGKLGDEQFLSSAWDEFCNANRKRYLRHLSAPVRPLRAVDRLINFSEMVYSSTSARASTLNLIRCESHREVLVHLLSKNLL